MALKPARLQWSDGETPESAEYGDVYFRRGEAFAESDYVFLQRNRLRERFAGADAFHVAEMGFGTGLNFLMTAQLWGETAKPGARLFYAGVEKHPVRKEDLARIYAGWPALAPLSSRVLAQYPPMVEGFHHIRLPGIHLMLLFGAAEEMLRELGGSFDAWYLDGFSPAKNPEMWDDALYPLIAARTKPGGTLSSFSAAGSLRRGLAAAGFKVRKEDGFGTKWNMTTARLPGETPEAPPKKDVVVFGAGLAGCSAACALARKGFRVTVVDREKSCAAEASGNPRGILYPKATAGPSPMGSFHVHGFCFTRALLEDLNIPSWTPCGVVRLDLGPEDAARSRAVVARNGYLDDFAKVLEDASGMTGIDTPGSALHHAGAGFLSPRELCAALLAHENIETRFGMEALLPDLQDKIAVVAMGNASAMFAQTARLPLFPLRGQVTFVAATAASAGLKTVLCHKGFVTPAVDGVHYCGATFQKEPQATPETRDADDAENLAALKRNVPALSSLETITGARAGWRATTPDKLPMAGAAAEGLYVSAGFGAHGLSGAPLCGELVAAMISGDPLPVPLSLAPYLAPGRFGERAERKKER